MYVNAISPGALDTGDSPFLLSGTEWINIQKYVTCALHVPTDQETMREKLPAEPDGGMGQFSDLLSAYKDCHEHCEDWHKHTFQDSVACAADIVHYNDKVPSYYGAITKLLPKLEQEPPDKAAVENFRAILSNLSGTAEEYSGRAESVRQGMMDFAEDSTKDANTLTILREKYKDKLGSTSPEIQKLQAEIAQFNEELKQADKEYQHDVIVAATTPTYAWICIPFPIGLVAAGIVAGIYGDRATKALNKMKELRAKIDLFSDKLETATILMTDLTLICDEIADISSYIHAALPSIQKVQGVWTAIHSDIENMLRIIDEDISQVPTIIKSLGIEEAIDSWAKVAHKADVYRLHAFVQVTTDEEAKKVGLELYEILKVVKSVS